MEKNKQLHNYFAYSRPVATVDGGLLCVATGFTEIGYKKNLGWSFMVHELKTSVDELEKIIDTEGSNFTIYKIKGRFTMTYNINFPDDEKYLTSKKALSLLAYRDEEEEEKEERSEISIKIVLTPDSIPEPIPEDDYYQFTYSGSLEMDIVDFTNTTLNWKIVEGETNLSLVGLSTSYITSLGKFHIFGLGGLIFDNGEIEDPEELSKSLKSRVIKKYSSKEGSKQFEESHLKLSHEFIDKLFNRLK